MRYCLQYLPSKAYAGGKTDDGSCISGTDASRKADGILTEADKRNASDRLKG